MRKRLLAIPLTLLWLAALTPVLIGSGGERPISDREMGLSKTSVLEIPSPAPVLDDLADPGETPRPPRFYPGSPPQIPHAVADMLPITRQENLCIDCHQVEESAEGEPTPIPEDHYVDFRHAPDKVRPTISGARHVCTSCHVSRTKNEPLVGNRFQALTLPAESSASP